MPRSLSCLICLALLGSLPPSSRAEEPYDSARVVWSRLDYQVTKLGIKARSEITLREVGLAEAATDLQPDPEGRALRPRGSKVALLTLDSKALWRESRLELWFDPIDAVALQRMQLETGKATRRNRYRLLRFRSDGVYSLTRKPTDGEVGRPSEEWSRVSEWNIDYPRRDLPAVSTPSALFYILSVESLDTVGEKSQLFMLSKSRLAEVNVEVLGTAEIEVDYLEVADGRESRLKARVETVEISLHGRAVDDGVNEESFEFLGLQGDVRVFLDPRSRVPLQVSGSIKIVGRGDVKLKRVELRQAEQP